MCHHDGVGHIEIEGAISLLGNIIIICGNIWMVCLHSKKYSYTKLTLKNESTSGMRTFLTWTASRPCWDEDVSNMDCRLAVVYKIKCIVLCGLIWHTE